MKPGWLATGWLTTFAGSLFPIHVLSDTVYTWTDRQGVVHFSDRAPAQRSATQLETAPPVLVPMESNLGAAKAIAETVRVSTAETHDNAPGRRQDKQHERRCADYREQLDRIQSRLRAGYSNAQGNRLRERRRALGRRLGRECILGYSED